MNTLLSNLPLLASFAILVAYTIIVLWCFRQSFLPRPSDDLAKAIDDWADAHPALDLHLFASELSPENTEAVLVNAERRA